MYAFLSSCVLLGGAQATVAEPLPAETRDQLTTLDTIRQAYATHYAPFEWKQQLFGWELDDAIESARQQILALPEGSRMTSNDFQRLVGMFQMTMRDYHVMIDFHRTEMSSLPIAVRGAEGRYFLVDIDRAQLPSNTFPFEIGDELVIFDGRPTDDVVQELRNSDMIENVLVTDQRLTEAFLCRRIASVGYLVPKGPISLGLKKQGEDKVRNVQLMWRYTTEKVATRSAGGARPWRRDDQDVRTQHFLLERLEGTSPIALAAAEPRSHGHSLGARRSFLPRLGEQIWWENDEASTFDAYIYAMDNGKRIGVVRIPDFGGSSEKAKELADLLEMMEGKTDALVIDQLNNPGGWVAYLFAVLSMFSDQPLDCAWHQIKLNPALVYDSQQELAELLKIKNQEQAVEMLGEDYVGLPVTMELVLFMINWHQRVIDAWNNGETLTSQIPFHWADKLPPYPTTHYSKPLLVLINELDFSCGDWFPATLQDNKRATLLGTRTAGAGGCVRWFDFPNNQGIAGMSVTWTLAHRSTGNPIENLGITPDIFVPLTVEDFQNNYKPFVDAVNAAVLNLVSPTPDASSTEVGGA